MTRRNREAPETNGTLLASRRIGSGGRRTQGEHGILILVAARDCIVSFTDHEAMAGGPSVPGARLRAGARNPRSMSS